MFVLSVHERLTAYRISWNKIEVRLLFPIWIIFFSKMYPYLLFFSKYFPVKDIVLYCFWDRPIESRLDMIFFRYLVQKTLSLLWDDKCLFRCLKSLLLKLRILDFTSSWDISELLIPFRISAVWITRVITRLTGLIEYTAKIAHLYFLLKMTFCIYSKGNTQYSFINL